MSREISMVKKVVFICMGNLCRSVFAEHLFHKMLQDMNLAHKIIVSSAGVFSDETFKDRDDIQSIWKQHGGKPKVFWGFPAYEHTKKALVKRGLDASKHVSRELTREIAETADLIISSDKAQKNLIISRYPSIRDRVYSFDELSEKHESLAVGDRLFEARYDPNSPILFTYDYDEYVSLVTNRIEEILTSAYGKILSLLEVE